MAKHKLIVHIGTHKTGSTTLQKTLHGARALLASHGVLYPKTDRAETQDDSEQTKHRSVTRAASSNDPAAEAAEYQALMTEFKASGCHTMLISAEGLCGSKPRISRFFERFTSDFDLTVICYMRRADLFVESYYNQLCREGHVDSATSVAEFAETPWLTKRLGYVKLLRRWQNVPARVVALDFAAEVKKHGLVTSFLSAAGLSHVGPLTEVRSNKSPNMNVAMLIRDLNTAKLPLDPNVLTRCAARMPPSEDKPELKFLLGSVARRQVLARFAADNPALERAFGLRFNAALPDEGESTISRPDFEYTLMLLGALSQTREPRKRAGARDR